MKTVLLTGAGGFLGRHVWRHCQAQGWRVLAMVTTPDSPACQLAEGGDRVLCGRLPEAHLADLLAEAPDYCVHLAGGASVPGSLADPGGDFHNAVAATEALCAALVRHAPRTRLAFVSSAAVYGNPQRLPVDEEAPLAPISPYGFHKCMAELVVRKHHVVWGLPAVTLRPFSLYGPGLRKQLFWDIHKKWKTEPEVALFGDGLETRDFLHVGDLLAALDLVLRLDAFAGGVYNVASGRETSIRDAAMLFLATLERRFGQGRPLRFTGQHKPGDPARWKVDVSRLAALGEFSPRPLEEGLADYADWLATIP